MNRWVDASVDEMKVILDPPFWIPFASGLVSSHVRSCIPILAPDGQRINFQKESRTPKSHEVIDRASEEADQEQLRQELEENALTSGSRKQAVRRRKAYQAERELLEKQRKRKEAHARRLWESREQLRQLTSTYMGSGEDPAGPVGDPFWFAPSPVNASEVRLSSEDCRVNISDLVDDWVSQKGREDWERVDKDEAFAILSYLENKALAEMQLSKYNILRVDTHKGFLLPHEPFRQMSKKDGSDHVPVDHPTKWWFANDDEELRCLRSGFAETRNDAWLDEYRDKRGYIQNPAGQRLVYFEKESSWSDLSWLKLGFGCKSGECHWTKEPVEGWDVFEKRMKDPGVQSTSVYKYADKWHWIALEKWDLPWRKESQLGSSLLSTKMQRKILEDHKLRVPEVIPIEERNEIRRWVWRSLLSITQLKLQLYWTSMQHPKYFDPQDMTLDEVARKDFDEVLLDIQKKRPHRAALIPEEHTSDDTEELARYCFMKMEDLYEDAGPWWDFLDKPGQDEQKIMFDHRMFLGHDFEVFRRRWEKRRHLPIHGYASSSCFQIFPKKVVGAKSYGLKMPEDPVECIVRVDMKMQLQHVPQLMRYSDNFKIRVPVDSLELPLQSHLAILLRQSRDGEQFTYVVDRLSTLVAIVLIESDSDGNSCAVGVLVLALISFGNRFLANWFTNVTEHAEMQVSRSSGRYLPLNEGKTQTKLTSLWQVALELETLTQLLKCLVLLFVYTSQYGWLPPPVCGISCILVSCTVMLAMNIGTFRKELNKNLERLMQALERMRRLKASVRRWLAKHGIVLVESKLMEDEEATVQEIFFVVPELGLHLAGNVRVDDGMSKHELRKQQLHKVTACFRPIREREDELVIAATDFERYYQDIVPGFTVALHVDQLNGIKAVPVIAATLQCVNFAGSRISRPELDSYFTLFYPEEWEKHLDDDPDAVKLLLELWNTEVRDWMEKSLGAVHSERTQTKKIQDHIAALLSKRFELNRIRHFVMVKVEHIMLPKFSAQTSHSQRDASKKKLYVTLLYEDEDFMKDTPTERSSGIARSETLSREKIEDMMGEGGCLRKFQDQMNAAGQYSSHGHTATPMMECFDTFCRHGGEFKVEMPLTGSRFKLMLWLQNDDEDTDGRVSEELLGISDPFSFTLPDKELAKCTDAVVFAAGHKRIPFYTSWRVTAGQELRRVQEDEGDVAERGCCASLLQRCQNWRAPPVTSEDVLNHTGFVDMYVRHPTDEEQELDVAEVAAVKDVVAGNSELNLNKLRRHLDRRAILAKFLGLEMDQSCVEDMKIHYEKLCKFKEEHMESSVDASMQSIVQETREQKLLELDIRRSLWKEVEMNKAIRSIEEGIEFWYRGKKQHDKLRSRPPYAVRARKRGPVIQPEPHVDYGTLLLEKLREFQEKETHVTFGILHYVMLADHLKPNKVWRPDAISAHEAGILLSVPQDIRRVVLYTDRSRMSFQLQVDANRLPLTCHGRLVFRATGLNAARYFELMDPDHLAMWKGPEQGSEVTIENAECMRFQPVYLYWDGISRWVCSPFCGKPVPYGLDTDSAMHVFMFCKDNAVTPDRVQKPFKVWNRRDQTWQEDASTRVLCKFHGQNASQPQSRADNAKLSAAGSSSEGLLSRIFSNMLAPTKSVARSPETRDCLLSFDGSNIVFTWRDLSQTELAPFRKFLLSTFGSYDDAWAYICRHSFVSKDLCVKNLARMLHRCHVELLAAQTVRRKVEKEAKKRKFAVAKMEKSVKTKATYTKDNKDEPAACKGKTATATAKMFSMFGWGKKDQTIKSRKVAMPMLPGYTMVVACRTHALKLLRASRVQNVV